MDYIEAMDYFYSIAPIKFSDAALYAIRYATISIAFTIALAFTIIRLFRVKNIPIVIPFIPTPIISGNFISEFFSFAIGLLINFLVYVIIINLFILLGLTYSTLLIFFLISFIFFAKNANINGANSKLTKYLSKPFIFTALSCFLIIFINTSYSRMNLNNYISKERIIWSSYFKNLDNDSKRFVKNYLIIGDDHFLTNPSLYEAIFDDAGDVDLNKINPESFSTDINIKSLKALIETENKNRKPYIPDPNAEINTKIKDKAAMLQHIHLAD